MIAVTLVAVFGAVAADAKVDCDDLEAKPLQLQDEGLAKRIRGAADNNWKQGSNKSCSAQGHLTFELNFPVTVKFVLLFEGLSRTFEDAF